MSEFMKTMSNLQQNFFACLPAIASREASALSNNPGGVPSRRVAAHSPGVWLPVDTKWGTQALTPGGWGGSQREAFFPVKMLILVTGQLWPASCQEAGRPDTRQPDAS